ncbi:AMP phosphorylase [archaeon]|jgi:AMP phosphorylase|nr:AMP phosphorylase [archaeon]MBT4416847.1 AMP phosphorylase [archaeon]
MKLKVKEVKLSTGGPLIAILTQKDARLLDLSPGDRVLIKRPKVKKEITCVVDISSMGIKNGEIGFFEEAFKALKAKSKQQVEVNLAEKPKSIYYIKKKLEGIELSGKEINEIVKDIIANKLSEVETTYFIAACYTKGMKLREAAKLTQSIVDNGETLKFKSKVLVDKHCIGGVPGNRTTMLVVPIMAALGYKMPKTSSRSITSPAGTSDTMEVLAPVSLSTKKIKKVVNKTGGCMAWGGAVNLAAADDKLIKLRHDLSIDPLGMMLASIMAKKKSVGSTHVLIDIPWGKGSKVANKKDAIKLKKLFIKIGKLLGMKVKVVMTDGTQPVGSGIGPALECSDVIAVLKGDGPNDLREKGVFLATEMLKLLKVRRPKKKVLDILDSGKAYKKFREIIIAQGGLKRPNIPSADLFYEYKATKAGKVKEINNKQISKLARIAGAPDDKVAGMYLRVRVHNKVKKGHILFTLYAKSQTKLDNAKKYLKSIKPIIY